MTRPGGGMNKLAVRSTAPARTSARVTARLSRSWVRRGGHRIAVVD